MSKNTARKVHDVPATSTVAGTAVALDVAIVDGSGNQITSFGGGGGGGSTIGAAVPSTATAIAVKDNSGNLAYPNVDGSGNLLVAVTGAGSGGTSSVDGAGYTAGTTAGTPLMGAFDDVSTTVLAENKIGVARLTTYRALHSNLRDGSGNELVGALDYDTGGGTVTQGIIGIALPASGGPVAGGTSTNPLRTDPTGTTAQPITDNSGSITVDNGGTFAVQSTIAASATNIAKAEDAASANADVGVPAMAIQLATPTDLAGTDADYAMLQMAGGRLWVDASGKTLTVAGTVIANLGTISTASTAAKQPALGTAGTASTDVITIQGIASMTKLLVTPDANSTVDINKLAGTTTDTNSGAKSAGTLRVVLATDQPALTNKLLVTPDLPALASTSTKQSDGSQKTQVVDGSGNVIGATSNALDINIKSGNLTTLPVTNAGTFAVQAAIAAGATNIAKAEDAAHSSGDTGVFMLGVRNDAQASFSGTDADYTPIATDSSGRVNVLQKAQTATLANVASSASSVTIFSANNSRIGAQIYNDSTQVLYVKFGTTASATSFTVALAAAAYYEVPCGYVGRIDGIWASANGNARTTEIT